MLSSVTMIACQRYKVVDPKLGLSCPTPQGLQEPFMCVISPIKVVIASSNMSAEDGETELGLNTALSERRVRAPKARRATNSGRT